MYNLTIPFWGNHLCPNPANSAYSCATHPTTNLPCASYTSDSSGEGWIDPWLDEEKLYPGQDWDLEIEKAVEAADAVIVFLSNNSVTKEGYVQRELRFVLAHCGFQTRRHGFCYPRAPGDLPHAAPPVHVAVCGLFPRRPQRLGLSTFVGQLEGACEKTGDSNRKPWQKNEPKRNRKSANERNARRKLEQEIEFRRKTERRIAEGESEIAIFKLRRKERLAREKKRSRRTYAVLPLEQSAKEES